MKLLVLGGYGFIGSEIVRAALAEGHEVRALGRDAALGRRLIPDAEWVEGDLNALCAPSAYSTILSGIDVAINASGLLQGSGQETVDRVQREAILALTAAAKDAGVRRIIQISAAGAAMNADTDFMRSKASADEAIARGPIDSLILRPGLVIGRNSYGGTDLLRMAAALPGTAIDLPLRAPIQIVGMSDVVEAVMTGISLPAGTRTCVDLVARESLELSAIVAAHRRWLGLRPARWSITLPQFALRVVTALADGLGAFGWRSPLRSNAVRVLAQGVAGNADETRTVLGRDAAPLDAVLRSLPSGKQDRLTARLSLILPLALLALGTMWFLSGLGTLIRLDEASALMVHAGFPPETAKGTAIAGALADIALAAGLLWRGAVRAALVAMIVLTISYLLAGTILAPSMWLDPLAPFAKTLPAAMLALLAFFALEKR